jgi:hypothetical protein
MIPGGIRFQDPRIPSMRWTDDHTWPEERATEVIIFRLANPKVYPPSESKWFDKQSVIQEIVDYNCQRLGNNPNFCTDSTATMKNVNATNSVLPHVEKCTCGANMIQRMSGCCGYATGWNCPQCNRVI